MTAWNTNPLVLLSRYLLLCTKVTVGRIRGTDPVEDQRTAPMTCASGHGCRAATHERDCPSAPRHVGGEPLTTQTPQTIHIRLIDTTVVDASVVDGAVYQVATETMRDLEQRQGCPVKPISTLRYLGPASHYTIREMVFQSTVELDGKTYHWRHIFTAPREPWPRLAEHAAGQVKEQVHG